MDKLGNRTNVNLTTGGDEAYTVDSLSNRYTAIAATSQAYDAAGNLTTDTAGYDHYYDYENRLVKVIDDSNTTITEYAYDALGRRIKRYDAIANETRYYYNNPKWQVLEEYVNGVADANLDKYHIYGNEIDETLFAYDISVGAGYLYAHDHLQSPAAIIHWNNTTNPVIERYEYDAYGNVTIMEPDYSARTASLYQNETLFTSRTLDTLDSGDLKIMYYRNRYYNPESGRFLTNDPLGITPNSQQPNVFNIQAQYTDGLNLYEYAKNSPIIEIDTYGLSAFPVLMPGFSPPVRPRSPKPTLKKCPECQILKPKPNHTPNPNGCGPAGGWYSPMTGKIGDVMGFTSACNWHDVCYGTCNKDKSFCDENFGDRMRLSCYLNHASPFIPDWLNDDLQNCYDAAVVFEEAVVLGGNSAYITAQNDACVCGCP